jgi:hypothetical protein
MAPKYVNEKAQAAKDRKSSAKEAEKAAKEKAAEDRMWKEAGEGAKSKAQAKRDEEAKQRAVSSRMDVHVRTCARA